MKFICRRWPPVCAPVPWALWQPTTISILYLAAPNPWLLKDYLRDQLGFDGIVMADGLAVDRLEDMAGSIPRGRACRTARRRGRLPVG